MPVKELHLSTHQQSVPLAELSVQPGLPGPGHGDHAGVILDDRLEDPQTASRGNDTLAANPADCRNVHAHLQLADRLDRRGIVVSAWDVVEEIARSRNSEPAKRVGSFRAHALQELHRPIELRVGQGPNTPPTNASTSKSSRSSRPSPVPTSFTGIPYSS